jgi:HAE1 family hydrophobic/amphiphilic exporter-1
MSLPGLTVKRRVTSLMVFLIMACAGFFALTQLGLDYFPQADLGEIVIVTVLPGAGPSEVEGLVTEIIEDAVSGVEGVETVESTSKNSTSGVTVVLSNTADIDEAEDNIRIAVDRVKSQLPQQASDPLIMALESSQKPLVILGFSSDVLNSGELRRLIGDEIVPVLGRVNGVASTQLTGGEIRQINVSVDPVLLWQRDIPISRVWGALQAVSGDQPGGDIDSENTEISISVRSGFSDLDQIRELVIGFHGGVPVRLRDVAEVTDGHREQHNSIYLDGEKSVVIIFRKSSDANTVNTCSRLEEAIASVSDEYGDYFSTRIVYSQKDFVIDSMRSLIWTGIQAVLLAAAVLLLFLGSLANAGIVSISMPLSFIATFAAMYMFGVNLNIMSLAGLSISIGMIVDNSVVVLENINRFRREGAGKVEGAERGASQVGMAVAASTMTTVAVFIPMLFVRGLTGQLFRDLSITIASALFISLFVSQTLIPLLASFSEKLVRQHGKRSFLGRIQEAIVRLEAFYSRVVSWGTANKWKVLLPVTAVFLISMTGFGVIPKSFLPDVKEGTMQIEIGLAQGTNLAFTDSMAIAIEGSVLAVIEPGDLSHSWLDVGRAEGIGAIFGSDATSKIELSLYFAAEGERSLSIEEYEESIRGVVNRVPGIEFSISSGMPIGQEYPIEVVVFGSDLEELRALGDAVRYEMDRIPGTVDVTSSLNEWNAHIDFVPDQNVLTLRGVSPAQIASEMTIGILGLDATTYTENDEEFDVNLRYSETFRSSREAVAALPALGAPLESWGSFENTLVPRSIGRRDRSRMVAISCRIDGRALGEVGGDVEAMMDTLDLGGHRWEITGDLVDQKKSFASMALAIGVAILLVYMVMASQFESLMEPFILLFEIPMAMIGVVWAHLLMGMTLGITSLVGILMLAGIVVNNGIVLVDYANQVRRSRNLNARDAVIIAGKTRMRPILMTAATTILALVPLSLGGNSSAAMWAPMARTVIGGLLVATPLTLLVLPVLYVMLGGSHLRRRRTQAEKVSTS